MTIDTNYHTRGGSDLWPDKPGSVEAPGPQGDRCATKGRTLIPLWIFSRNGALEANLTRRFSADEKGPDGMKSAQAYVLAVLSQSVD